MGMVMHRYLQGLADARTKQQRIQRQCAAATLLQAAMRGKRCRKQSVLADRSKVKVSVQILAVPGWLAGYEFDEWTAVGR